MNKSLKDKNIKTRTIQIIYYLVMALLCCVIGYSAITAYKNSSKLDALQDIKDDLQNLKDRMVDNNDLAKITDEIKAIKEYIADNEEKIGMKPSESTVLVSRLQGGEIGGKKSIERKEVDQQKTVTGRAREAISIPDEEVEPSIEILRERLKSYDVRLEKSAGPSEAKTVEELIEPVSAQAPEEDLLIPQVINIRAKTKKAKTTRTTKQKYHIVQRGETLSHIAKKYDISIDEIGKLNNIDPSQLIHPGQKILVTKDSKE